MRIANRSNHPIHARFDDDIEVTIEPGECIDNPAGKTAVRIDHSPQEVGVMAHPMETRMRREQDDYPR